MRKKNNNPNYKIHNFYLLVFFVKIKTMMFQVLIVISKESSNEQRAKM